VNTSHADSSGGGTGPGSIALTLAAALGAGFLLSRASRVEHGTVGSCDVRRPVAIGLLATVAYLLSAGRAF
jgi:hypothetical protein